MSRYVPEELRLIPKTDVAAATIKILQLNHPDSVIERKAMLDKGIF